MRNTTFRQLHTVHMCLPHECNTQQQEHIARSHFQLGEAQRHSHQLSFRHPACTAAMDACSSKQSGGWQEKLALAAAQRQGGATNPPISPEADESDDGPFAPSVTPPPSTTMLTEAHVPPTATPPRRPDETAHEDGIDPTPLLALPLYQPGTPQLSHATLISTRGRR